MTTGRRGDRPGALILTAPAVGLVILLVVGCARGDVGTGVAGAEHHTIAFLRAVAGTPSTEPTFLQELRAAGFVAGRGLTILAFDPDEAYPDPADAERVVSRWRAQGLDLVVALSSSGAAAARAGAPSADVLFLSNDPTATGLVEDEQRPEGRLTGVTFRVPADRTLDLARRAVPGLRRVGMATPTDDPAAVANTDAVAAAASALGIELRVEPFDSPDAVDRAVAALAASGVDALLLSTSPTAVRSIAETEAAARRHRLPVVANTSLADAALVALYPDSAELGRQLGRQAARLLAGNPVSAVPVEDPRRYLLVIDVGAADRLGITVPEDVLQEANVVLTGDR